MRAALTFWLTWMVVTLAALVLLVMVVWPEPEPKPEPPYRSPCPNQVCTLA